MGPPRRTASGSSSTSVTVPIDEAVEQLLQETADISKLSSSENVMGVIVTILGQLLKSDRENNKMKERIAELEKRNEEQDRKIADFELRLFKMEQYSSRSTAIMTGVPANGAVQFQIHRYHDQCASKWSSTVPDPPLS